MDIIVKAKNCDVSERLREDAVERVAHALRFYDRLDGVEVVFRSESTSGTPESAVVELSARAKGRSIRARGAAGDHRGAIDAVLARFERQLRRFKARQVDGRRRAGRAQPTDAQLLDVPDVGDPRGEPLEAPPIVRRKRFSLSPMTIEEAALNLELLDHDFYVFTNVHTAECNVVYRRRDGDLGLLEAASD